MAIRFVLAVTFLQFLALIAILLIDDKSITLAPYRAAMFDIRRAVFFRGELILPLFGSRQSISFLAINPDTGERREICNLPTTQIAGVVGGEKALWIVGEQRVCEFDGRKSTIYFAKCSSTTGSKVPIWCSPFLFEDCPAFIDFQDKENVHLLVLSNREWVDRGEIAIPGPTRVWQQSAPTGELTLIPRTSAEGHDASAFKRFSLHTVVADGVIHQFQIDPLVQRICYRTGFDGVERDAKNGPASALAPANAPADTTGWTLLDPGGLPEVLSPYLSVHFHEGILIAINNRLFRVRTRESSRSINLEELRFQGWPAELDRTVTINAPRNKYSYNWREMYPVSDPVSKKLYFVTRTQAGETDLYRIDGESMVKLPFHYEGWSETFFRRAGIVGAQFLAVFWIGALLLIVQAGWISRHVLKPTYSFGRETVSLASIDRRAAARCVDLVLIIAPLVVQTCWILRDVAADAVVEWYHSLFLPGSGASFHPTFPLAGFVCSVVALLACVTTTALWGVTPGKWLCGVRVVRTTLRPCGFARALLRDFLLWIDTPLLITPAPAIVSQLCTQYRQRIGDLLADTIVIHVDNRPARPEPQ